MEKRIWVDALIEKRKLEKGFVIKSLDNSFPVYLIDGINAESSTDEYLIVYDCSNFSESSIFRFKDLLKVIEDNNDPYPVVVFKNWEHERKIYWSYNELLKKGEEKKRFSDWYDKKISIYVDGISEIFLETDDMGINYLEYPVKKANVHPRLNGRVYNISFFELKKLFNVTGAHLFVKNVRYGLKKNSIGETLRLQFREYLSIALYKKAIDAPFPLELFEKLKEKLENDTGLMAYFERNLEKENNLEYDGEISLPENFWFYHNGISIFSCEENLYTSTNRITLSPAKVSVINGAQTLTNFFLEVENIEHLLADCITECKCCSLKIDIDAKKIIDSIIKSIFVKTIIIYGNDEFVRPITHGLNTQIPIFEESLLADSKVSDEINEYLANSTKMIRILKDGEMWTGKCGVNVLDFVKNWMTINDEPGKSKNLSKKELDRRMREIRDKLKDDDSNIHKMVNLFQIYQWWDNAREYRIVEHGDDEDSVVIGKYGRNYFGNYVLHILDDSTNDISLDDDFLTISYERFVRDLKYVSSSMENKLKLGDFKKDDLSCLLIASMKKDYSESEVEVRSKTIEEDLKLLLNKEGQSAYSFSKTIADYLLEHNINLDYFRVISRTGKKCKEAFPFPNSTFNEIVDSSASDEMLNGCPNYKKFNDSNFQKSIDKVFPIFVIDKDDKESKHLVTEIHFIKEFSFKQYKEDAEKVYLKTIEAFKLGDEKMFPSSSDKMCFHIRPKAINSEDTFQFTNGNYITKRTFWANKSTVESLINEVLDNDEKKDE